MKRKKQLVQAQAQRQEARELAADLGSSPRGRDYSASPDREPSPVPGAADE